MGFYENKRDLTVAPAFKKYGAKCVLRWDTAAVVSQATGKVATAGSTNELSAYVLLKDYKSKEIDGTNVLRTDRKGLMTATECAKAGVVPEVGMKLVIGEREYRIQFVDPLAPGDIAVFYTLQLRD